MTFNNKIKDKEIWDFLIKEGLSEYGAAGLMGNLYAESGLHPDRVQGDIPYSIFSQEYTNQVDRGIISENDFIHNGPNGGGYGLAQWTYYTRKRSLYRFAKNLNTSVGNLETQLKFLINELKNNYTNSVYKILLKTQSVKEASDAVLFKFEKPANAADKAEERTNLGWNFYNKFSKGEDEMVKTYKRNEGAQLSKNFTSNEFQCKCGRCSSVLIDDKLVEFLQNIREHFNAPIIINSGYRCPAHNAAVGGASGSKHRYGEAADIVVTGIAPREVAKYAESIGVLGIGLYETAGDGYFTHIDTRKSKAFWYGQRQQYRSTFGGNKPVEPSKNANTSTNPGADALNYTTYKRGDSGAGVKFLQEKLITLGYNVGSKGADGVYGGKTKNAVLDFQKKMKLGQDGIAGPQTQKAIDEALKEKASDKNEQNRRVQVTASGLNVRQGAGTSYPVVGVVYKGSVHKITDIDGNWGQIEKPDGWINLSYVKEV